jgi:hypothetical protein
LTLQNVRRNFGFILCNLIPVLVGLLTDQVGRLHEAGGFVPANTFTTARQLCRNRSSAGRLPTGTVYFNRQRHQSFTLRANAIFMRNTVQKAAALNTK